MTASDLIKGHEGLRLLPYTDTTGHITIGYGTNLSSGITLTEAVYLLESRLQRIQGQLGERLSWYDSAPLNIQVVLTDMAYNMGIEGLMAFKKMLTALQANELQDAADEMRNSLWAKEVGERCEEDIKILLGGGE